MDQKVNRRVMVTFIMLFSFVILPFSGLLLHLADDHASGSLKTFSMTFHNIAAIVFTIAAVIHVKYNGKSILFHVKDPKKRGIRYPREISIAITIMLIIFLLATVHVFHGHM